MILLVLLVIGTVDIFYISPLQTVNNSNYLMKIITLFANHFKNTTGLLLEQRNWQSLQRTDRQ